MSVQGFRYERDFELECKRRGVESGEIEKVLFT